MGEPVWQCHGCGNYREDEWISVAHRKILGVLPHLPPIQLNARYCNDRPTCLLAVVAVLDQWARALVGQPTKEPHDEEDRPRDGFETATEDRRR